MRSLVVVVASPTIEFDAGVTKGLEQGFVQALVAQATVEALDKGILLGLSWRDVMPVDAGLVRPFQDRVRCELGSIVADDPCRLSASSDHRVELAGDATP